MKRINRVIVTAAAVCMFACAQAETGTCAETETEASAEVKTKASVEAEQPVHVCVHDPSVFEDKDGISGF